MRSETQPYSNYIAIRLCRTAHTTFFPKFWNDETNFTRVSVTVSPRRPWDRGWLISGSSVNSESGTLRFKIRIDVYFLQTLLRFSRYYNAL